MKTIVTHLSPDFDAVVSCWLIKNYFPGWKNAKIKFIPAGLSTDKNNQVDSDNLVYVDVGFGKFDHHQYQKNTSASEIVFEYLNQKQFIPKKDIQPLERLIEIVTFIDNFQEIHLPNPSADIYDTAIYRIIDSLNSKYQNDEKTFEISVIILDALFILFKNKISAEKEIGKGLIFRSKWGKSLALLTKNDESLKLAQKLGYDLVVRKDPDNQTVRIKVRPDNKYDLTPVYLAVKKTNPQATWFFHSSKKMLLNGSLKNPNTVPSNLSLEKVVEIIKRI